MKKPKPKKERCRVCKQPVLVMAYKGSGLCGQRCAKAAS